MSEINEDEKYGEKYQYWQTHINAWKQSGISQSDFCRQHGLNIKIFGYWKRKLCSKSEYQRQKVSSTPVPHEGISEGISLLLEHIRNVPGKRIPQLSVGLGLPAKTIERWIANLKRQGCIEYRGSKKAGGYYAVNTKEQGKGKRT